VCVGIERHRHERHRVRRRSARPSATSQKHTPSGYAVPSARCAQTPCRAARLLSPPISSTTSTSNRSPSPLPPESDPSPTFPAGERGYGQGQSGLPCRFDVRRLNVRGITRRLSRTRQAALTGSVASSPLATWVPALAQRSCCDPIPRIDRGTRRP
jgi:hypothetical protein